MLSSFRNIMCRQPGVVRRALASTYSTGPDAPAAEIKELVVVLEHEAKKQQTPAKSKLFGASGSPRDKRRDSQTKWKPFPPNRLLRPHEFTYKTRINEPRQFARRPAVGPAPNVARYNDVFHQLNIDPLSQAQNPAILSEFMSEMGKIYSRNITGLTSKSQRRIGKAIRRAKMMGVIPILSRPEKDVYAIQRRR